MSVCCVSAGTIEFLVDNSGHYYFIEMNTRIQVEHTITEEVYGCDLVKEQIKIAAGEHLSPHVAHASPRSHAIQCRINAEDPETFVPSAGRITTVELFAENLEAFQGLRLKPSIGQLLDPVRQSVPRKRRL